MFMEEKSTIRALLAAAVEKRAGIAENSNAYRVVNGAGDSLPGVTLDRFNEHYQIQYFGHELLGREAELVEAVRELCAPAYLAVKYRLEAAGKALEHPEIKVVLGSDSATIVQEGNCFFKVDLADTVNPGLFLDMRDVRMDVERRCGAKNGAVLLNLFSYTCSFGVHARVGGAEKAVNADISGKILEKGRENYALNGLECKPGEFFKGNAFEYLAWAKKKGLFFDGIVLDPPSFARFKGFSFNVRNDFSKLVLGAAEVLAPGGFLMASSNYSGFELRSFGQNVLATVKTVFPKAKLAWTRSQGADFPGSGSTKDSCLCAAMIEV